MKSLFSWGGDWAHQKRHKERVRQTEKEMGSIESEREKESE